MEDDDLLHALGKVARERREEEDRRIANDPALSRPLDDLEQARIVAALPKKAPAKKTKAAAWIVPFAAALAIAAGVFLFVGRKGGPALPAYELVVVAGDRDVRGADAAVTEVRTLGPDSKFELLLRPATAVKDVSARGFLIQNGVATSWNVRPLASEDGAVRFTGTARTLFGDLRGEVGVLVVVGRSAIAVTDLSDEKAGRIYAGEPSDFVVARVRVLLAP